MKNRLYNVIKLCVMAVLLGVTGQVYAQSTPRLIVNDLTNGSATWYSDAGKTTKIDAVPYSATEQTLYIDIQPAEGYWTTGDALNGKVEKFVKPSAAGTRVGSIALAQYALTKADGQTYAKNGAGVYQVTIPGMGTETEAGEITKFVLTADFYPYTDITASVADKELTYSGVEQKGETEVTFTGLLTGHKATITYNPAKGTTVNTYSNGSFGTDLKVTDDAGSDVTVGYSLKTTTAGKLTIKPAPLTVTAKDKTIKYGDEAANDGVTYEGFVNSETASVLGGTLSYAYKTKEDGSGDDYTKTSPVGTYYIIPSGLTSANYDITFKAGKLTVSNSPVVIGGDDDPSATATIEVSPKEFTYNGKDQKPEVKVVMKADKKVIDSKEYTVTYKKGDTEVSETKDAGTYTVVISNKTGADYAFSGKTTASYTIKPAELKVTAKPQSKKVGEADPELTYTYEGLVKGDEITGALTRDAGEAAGSYAIKLGTLTAGTNYAITFTGANLTITDDSSVPEESTYYKITVVKTEGGKVNSTHVKATVGQQVNLVVIPDEGYEMSSLVVVNNSAKTSVSTGITYDKDGKPFNYFLMPASDVTVTAIFQKVNQDKDFKQNIFIFRNPYGEVVSNLLYAESGQQVNLETRIKDGFTNVVLDDLYVINEKGEQLQLFYLVDPIEGPVHLFFMRGEKAYVFNSFKGTNGIVDDSNPLPLDMDYVLYLINNIFGSNFLNLNNGAEGVQVAMSLLANLLANVTTDGELSVNKGPEDLLMALLNLKSGWKIKIDFTGIIQLLNPELLGLGKGATLTSGQIYELLTPGNLQLLLNSSYGPLLIKSITVIAPDSETDPTAINGLKADGAAGKIYDLRGRKMDTTNLRKGIYIRDGKKVVIK